MLWRTRVPLVTLAVVLTAPVARHEVGGGGDGLHCLAVLVAVYSVGVYGQRREGLIAAVLLLALVGPGEWAKLADGGGLGELVGPVLSMVLAFGMGRFVGSRSRQVRDAEQRASEVERDRDEQARAAVAEERARIARELHDIVAHHVSVMVIQAQAGQRLLGPGEGEPGRH